MSTSSPRWSVSAIAPEPVSSIVTVPPADPPGAMPVAEKIGAPSWELVIRKEPEAGDRRRPRPRRAADLGQRHRGHRRQPEDDRDRQVRRAGRQASHQNAFVGAGDWVAVAADITLPARS